MNHKDVIKLLNSKIAAEMAGLKDADKDDMYAQGKIQAYTNVTQMLLEIALTEYPAEAEK